MIGIILEVQIIRMYLKLALLLQGKLSLKVMRTIHKD